MTDPAGRRQHDASCAPDWFVPRTAIPHWTPAETELIRWRGPGYPAELEPVLQRFEDTYARALRTGQGWWPLILRAHNDLLALDPEYVLRVVAEEEAELRLDAISQAAHSPVDAFRDVIRDAENLSGRICEVCGGQGRMMRQGDWLVTLCWDDAARYGAHRIAADEDLDGVTPRATDEEFTFASSAGASPDTYTVTGQAEQRTYLELSRRQADATIAAWPGTAEVSRLLGLSCDDVERLRTSGRIGAERGHDGQWRYAPWQIGEDGRLIPHLSEVLRATPADYTLIDLTHVLMEPDESLGDQSPVDWLQSGRGASEVLRMLDELTMT